MRMWEDVGRGSNILMLFEPDSRLLDLYSSMRTVSPYDCFETVGQDLWDSILGAVEYERDEETLKLLCQDLEKQAQDVNIERQSASPQHIGT